MPPCIRIIWSVLVIALISGCAKKEKHPEINIGVGPSVTFELPKGNTLNIAVSAKFGTNRDGYRFEFDGKNISFNGKKYGVVQAGDRVVLDESGKVTVNGQERAAQ